MTDIIFVMNTYMHVEPRILYMFKWGNCDYVISILLFPLPNPLRELKKKKNPSDIFKFKINKLFNQDWI